MGATGSKLPTHGGLVCISTEAACRVLNVEVSNESWSTILSVFDLNVVTKQANPEEWLLQVEKIRKGYTQACRWKIGKGFVNNILPDSDCIISLEHPILVDKETLTVIDAFVLIQQLDSTSYEFELICSADIYAQDKRLNLRLGAILHGLAVQQLLEQGATQFYLEAATPELIPYYQTQGYEVNSNKCFAITPQLTMDSEPTATGTHQGYLMRLCNPAQSNLLALLPRYVNQAAKELTDNLLNSPEALEEFY